MTYKDLIFNQYLGHPLSTMSFRLEFERSWHSPWTPVTPSWPWLQYLLFGIGYFGSREHLNGFKHEVVRQAVWESLETFAAIVNAACEEDLDGEVTYLIIIVVFLSWIV